MSDSLMPLSSANKAALERIFQEHLGDHENLKLLDSCSLQQTGKNFHDAFTQAANSKELLTLFAGIKKYSSPPYAGTRQFQMCDSMLRPLFEGMRNEPSLGIKQNLLSAEAGVGFS